MHWSEFLNHTKPVHGYAWARMATPERDCDALSWLSVWAALYPPALLEAVLFGLFETEKRHVGQSWLSGSHGAKEHAS